MNRRFGKLFEIVFEHSYFEDKGSNLFAVSPTTDTLSELKRNGLLYRETPSGCLVLYQGLEKTPNTITPLHDYDLELKLSFTVEARHPQFLQITNLPLQGSPFYYFNNYKANLSDDGERQIFGNGQDTDAASDKDQLPIQDERLEVSLQTEDLSKTLKLTDEHGAKHIDKTLETIPLENGKRLLQYLADLRPWGPGKYTLKIQGENPYNFYASEKLYALSPLAYIELSAHHNAPESYRYIDDKGVPFEAARTYYIKFAPRSTRWSYSIVPKVGSKLKPADLSIIGNPHFTEREAIKLASGRPAIRIQSTSTFPMKEKSDLQLSLKNTPDNKTYIERLPVPNPASLKRSPFDSPNIYSEAIVYI